METWSNEIHDQLGAERKAKLREKARRYRERHKEMLGSEPERAKHRARCQRYRETHREAIRLRDRAYSQTERGRQVKRASTKTHKARQRQLRKSAKSLALTRQQWDKIIRLSLGRCYWCKRKMAVPTQDHVIPLSKGGLHEASNVVAACKVCNSKKGAKRVTLL